MAYTNEHKLAQEALARLRAENRRASGPFRASTLAEAETAPAPDKNATSDAVLREHGLTGKYKAKTMPRAWSAE